LLEFLRAINISCNLKQKSSSVILLSSRVKEMKDFPSQTSEVVRDIKKLFRILCFQALTEDKNVILYEYLYYSNCEIAFKIKISCHGNLV
jgi:hypothetical protein